MDSGATFYGSLGREYIMASTTTRMQAACVLGLPEVWTRAYIRAEAQAG